MEDLNNSSFQYRSICVFLNMMGKVKIKPDLWLTAYYMRQLKSNMSVQILSIWSAVLENHIFSGTWPGVTVPNNCILNTEYLFWSKHSYFKNFPGRYTVDTTYYWFLISFVRYELDLKGCLRKENRSVLVLPRNREILKAS